MWSASSIWNLRLKGNTKQWKQMHYTNQTSDHDCIGSSIKITVSPHLSTATGARRRWVVVVAPCHSPPPFSIWHLLSLPTFIMLTDLPAVSPMSHTGQGKLQVFICYRYRSFISASLCCSFESTVALVALHCELRWRSDCLGILVLWLTGAAWVGRRFGRETWEELAILRPSTVDVWAAVRGRGGGGAVLLTLPSTFSSSLENDNLWLHIWTDRGGGGHTVFWCWARSWWVRFFPAWLLRMRSVNKIQITYFKT